MIRNLLIALLITAVTAGCGWLDSRSQPACQHFLDTLPLGTNQVRLRTTAPLEQIGSNDVNNILIALARTPGVRNEVLGIRGFPNDDFPLAAQVQVEGQLLYLNRDSDNNWRVFRIVKYVH